MNDIKSTPPVPLANQHDTLGWTLTGEPEDDWLDDGMDTPVNTFGVALTRDERHDDLHGLITAAKALGSLTDDELSTLNQLDLTLAVWSKRWRWNPDTQHLTGPAGKLEPGDICMVRSSINREVENEILSATAHRKADEEQGRTSLIFARDAILQNRPVQQLMAAGTACFMPNTEAWSAMSSRPLTNDDRNELRLDAATVVLFDTAMEIPAEYLSLDASRIDPDEIDVPARHTQPIADQLTLEEGESFGWKLAGVILVGTSDGRLADSVVWLCHKPGPTVKRGSHPLTDNVYSSTAFETVTGYGVVVGSLRRSLLAPIAESLAAMVSWGTWTAPQPAPDIAELAPVRKKSKFRKDYRTGHLSGVRVIDIKPNLSLRVTPASSASERSNPRAHFRRGFWKRVRVGKRTNWHYERRRIPPTIVNAGNNPIGEIARVYRLPIPSTEKEEQS